MRAARSPARCATARASSRPPTAARARLSGQEWPGKVRGVGAALAGGVVLAPGARIEPEALGPARAWGPGLRSESGAAPAGEPAPLLPLRLGVGLRKALEEPEREIIKRTLELNHGSRQATARMLELNRATLFNKMRKYDLLSFPHRRD